MRRVGMNPRPQVSCASPFHVVTGRTGELERPKPPALGENECVYLVNERSRPARRLPAVFAVQKEVVSVLYSRRQVDLVFRVAPDKWANIRVVDEEVDPFRVKCPGYHGIA